ncbi:MAG: DUF2147 domain-containing protein, partial [Betaproteobacteria bacterium]
NLLAAKAIQTVGRAERVVTTWGSTSSAKETADAGVDMGAAVDHWFEQLTGEIPVHSSDRQDFAGSWRTSDRSVFEITPCPHAAALCGYLVVSRKRGTDALNPDPALRKRSLCGLPLLELGRWDNGVWRDGNVYEPESGKTYKAALHKREGKLHLRAYIGTEVFGETETWTAATDFKPGCTP